MGAAPTFYTAVPASESPADIAAARDELFSLKGSEIWRSGWSLDPEFSGKYPDGYEEALGDAVRQDCNNSLAKRRSCWASGS